MITFIVVFKNNFKLHLMINTLMPFVIVFPLPRRQIDPPFLISDRNGNRYEHDKENIKKFNS